MGRTNSRKRTHHKQLAKNAAKRQLERMEVQRRHRYRAGAVIVAGVLAIALVTGLFFWGPGRHKSAAQATPRPSASGAHNDKPGLQTGTVTSQATIPTAVACGGQVPAAASKPKPQFSSAANVIAASATYLATFNTSCGSFTVKLDGLGAPAAVNNFLFLVKNGFYDGTWFHRIVKGFMIQGGDPQGTGMGGPGYLFPTKVNQTLRFGGPAGVLAYANAGTGDGSQFFVTVAPQPFLDNQGPYTAFGTVTSGMDVVKKISLTPTTANASGEQSQPQEAVYIDSITIKKMVPPPATGSASPSASPSG